MYRAIVALLLITACSGSPSGPTGEWFRDLRNATRRWEAAAVSDYSYTYTRSCFCPQQVLRVTVQGGVVQSIRDIETDTMHKAPLTDLSIGGLLDTIAVKLSNRPADAVIEYHATFGYPVSTMFDPIAKAVDDENGFQVSGFESIP